MPDFVFDGPYPHHYPQTRDLYGVQLGEVSPGDVEALDEPPDGLWRPYEPGDDSPEPASSDEAGQPGEVEG